MNKQKFRVGVVGAGGFTGLELLRILSSHSHVEIVYATSNEYQNQKVLELFPQLANPSLKDLLFTKHPQSPHDVPDIDFAFTATPDLASLQLAAMLIAKNIRVIDIAGIFRLKDKDIIQHFYGIAHDQPELLSQAVYGLPEVYREQIQSAALVANPGCYPTSVLLPLFAIREFLTFFDSSIIVDSKSGTSGAGGRKEKESLTFSSVNENFRAYKVEKHQHQPEIQSYLNQFSNHPFSVRFTPHLLPIERGILSTIYLRVKKENKDNFDCKKMVSACQQFAEQEQFIRFYESPNDIDIKKIVRTNFLDFSFVYDETNHIVVMISTIDNLMKGAASQAIQNFNIMIQKNEQEAL